MNRSFVRAYAASGRPSSYLVVFPKRFAMAYIYCPRKATGIGAVAPVIQYLKAEDRFSCRTYGGPVTSAVILLSTTPDLEVPRLDSNRIRTHEISGEDRSVSSRRSEVRLKLRFPAVGASESRVRSLEFVVGNSPDLSD